MSESETLGPVVGLQRISCHPHIVQGDLTGASEPAQHPKLSNVLHTHIKVQWVEVLTGDQQVLIGTQVVEPQIPIANPDEKLVWRAQFDSHRSHGFVIQWSHNVPVHFVDTED